MASIRYSFGVDQVKGSIAGTTFQSNRSGFTVRSKPFPGNKRSPAQMIVRFDYAGLSQEWRTLDPAERLSWAMVAPNWSAVDRFGDPVSLSGYSVYMLANKGLIAAGASPSLTGVNPAVLQNPDAPSMVISAGAGTAIWTFSNSPISADNALTLFSSRLLSAGRAYQPTGLVGIYRAAAAATSPIDVWPELVSHLGQAPVVGAKIWFQARTYSTTSGNSSAPFPFSAIVQP